MKRDCVAENPRNLINKLEFNNTNKALLKRLTVVQSVVSTERLNNCKLSHAKEVLDRNLSTVRMRR